VQDVVGEQPADQVPHQVQRLASVEPEQHDGPDLLADVTRLPLERVAGNHLAGDQAARFALLGRFDLLLMLKSLLLSLQLLVLQRLEHR